MKKAFLKTPFVFIFLILNTIVFLLWSQGDDEFMLRHFSVSWHSLAEGRLWTTLSSVFSHYLFLHFVINMYVLKSFGGVVEEVLGSKRFLLFYMIAGFVSSLSHSVVSTFVIGDPSVPAVGASGSIAGLILLFSLLFPRQKILLFGIVPIPALFGALAFIGLDIWGLIEQAQGGGFPIGHGAHLGGAFVGIIYYFHLRRLARKHKTHLL